MPCESLKIPEGTSPGGDKQLTCLNERFPLRGDHGHCHIIQVDIKSDAGYHWARYLFHIVVWQANVVPQTQDLGLLCGHPAVIQVIEIEVTGHRE